MLKFFALGSDCLLELLSGNLLIDVSIDFLFLVMVIRQFQSLAFNELCFVSPLCFKAHLSSSRSLEICGGRNIVSNE